MIKIGSVPIIVHSKCTLFGRLGTKRYWNWNSNNTLVCHLMLSWKHNTVAI